MNRLNIIKNGILKENPVLVLVLGTCPALAVTSSAQNGLGMGIAVILVLMGSNAVISLLRNIIPDTVRIPAYIVLICTFVTIVELLTKAFVRPIYDALGIFLPLIVVNCIILGRAEMFANKHGILDSVCDAIGMGCGFTLTLVVMGSIREILGSGTWFGITLTKNLFDPMLIFTLAPGGFFVFGCLKALVNKLTKGKLPQRNNLECASCPMAASCGNSSKKGKGC